MFTFYLIFSSFPTYIYRERVILISLSINAKLITFQTRIHSLVYSFARLLLLACLSTRNRRPRLLIRLAYYFIYYTFTIRPNMFVLMVSLLYMRLSLQLWLIDVFLNFLQSQSIMIKTHDLFIFVVATSCCLLYMFCFWNNFLYHNLSMDVFYMQSSHIIMPYITLFNFLLFET